MRGQLEQVEHVCARRTEELTTLDQLYIAEKDAYKAKNQQLTLEVEQSEILVSNLKSQIEHITKGKSLQNKLDNEILKEAKNAEKSHFRPKNVIFDRF